jgi:hypothetical protein
VDELAVISATETARKPIRQWAVILSGVQTYRLAFLFERIKQDFLLSEVDSIIFTQTLYYIINSGTCQVKNAWNKKIYLCWYGVDNPTRVV